MANQQQHIRSDGTPSPDAAPNHRHSDGSPALTGPPSQPARPPGDAAQLFAGYSDPSYVGTRDERAAFEAARGNPGPRHPAHELDGEFTHQEPGEASSADVAPLT